MEDMGAVLMHPDARHRLAVDVAGDVIPLVDHQAGLAAPGRLVGKHRPEQPRAHDQIIVPLAHIRSPFS